MMTHDNRPIGIFDSGLGGLSVYIHLKNLLPHEQFIYFADTKHVPYGQKDSNTIKQLTDKAVQWLVGENVKMVVIACNSASAYSLQFLRQKYNIPIVGLVPAVKPACAITQSKKIAVLATQATLQGERFKALVDEFATPYAILVESIFLPNLVNWVENGMPYHHNCVDELAQLVVSLGQNHIDTLVLGCTHYPFFKQLLQQFIKQHQLTIQVLDSGLAIAKRVQSLLLHNQLTTNHQIPTTLQFYASRAFLPTLDIAKTLTQLPIESLS